MSMKRAAKVLKRQQKKRRTKTKQLRRERKHG